MDQKEDDRRQRHEETCRCRRQHEEEKESRRFVSDCSSLPAVVVASRKQRRRSIFGRSMGRQWYLCPPRGAMNKSLRQCSKSMKLITSRTNTETCIRRRMARYADDVLTSEIVDSMVATITGLLFDDEVFHAKLQEVCGGDKSIGGRDLQRCLARPVAETIIQNSLESSSDASFLVEYLLGIRLDYCEKFASVSSFRRSIGDEEDCVAARLLSFAQRGVITPAGHRALTRALLGWQCPQDDSLPSGQCTGDIFCYYNWKYVPQQKGSGSSRRRCTGKSSCLSTLWCRCNEDGSWACPGLPLLPCERGNIPENEFDSCDDLASYRRE